MFVSYKPDKRGRLYKFLEKNATIKTFDKLSGIELKNFVKNELKELTIDHDTIDFFLEKVGNDLYNIINECDKLKTWMNASPL
jgi:DNA polymerase III delta subunit